MVSPSSIPLIVFGEFNLYGNRREVTSYGTPQCCFSLMPTTYTAYIITEQAGILA